MAKKKRMPEQLYIYVTDVLKDGTILYGAAATLDEVPEEAAELIGVYEHIREAKLVVTRDLE